MSVALALVYIGIAFGVGALLGASVCYRRWRSLVEHKPNDCQPF